MVCFFFIIAWQSYWGKILESEAIPKDVFLPWLSNSVFMNLCCLVDCHPGYISPLTTKILLKWGINSSWRPGIHFGLAVRWQDALKDQMLCCPWVVGGAEGQAACPWDCFCRTATWKDKLVSPSSSWLPPQVCCCCHSGIVSVWLYACSHAFVSSNPSAVQKTFKGIHNIMNFLSASFCEWLVRLALYSHIPWS